MVFKGKVVNVVHSPLYDASTVTLELENGHALEIVVTRQLAIQFGENLYSAVGIEVKDPAVTWPDRACGHTTVWKPA